MKKRADLLLVEKNLALTRSKAQAMIMAGQVSIEGKNVTKSSETFLFSSKITIKPLNTEWVSRGAYKLLHALNIFNIKVENQICMDIGASTGGFSQVLLNKKAKKIYSIDVGTNQLHEKLKKEKKIINLEKTNARYIKDSMIPDKINIIVCDVSFISLKKVIKPCLTFINKKSGIIITLIKPQFESKKNEIRRGGIIKDPLIHKRICEEIEEWFFNDCQMKIIGITESPLKGPKGNKEFLIATKFN